MPVYHQIGHQSDNLLTEPLLDQYAGAILSPVNYDELSMLAQVQTYRGTGNRDIIFDPQIYYPRTELVRLRTWSYFPSDFSTVDSASDQWWSSVVANLVPPLEHLQPDAICSPAFVPRTFSNQYFDAMTRVAGMMVDAVSKLDIAVLQTVIVNLSDLADPQRAYEIASIITRSTAARVYLVLLGNTVPRREVDDTEALKGAMLLIYTLEQSGMPVLVGFSSSDVILWKAAGATACATGKFWNLRRFTPSRWDPADAGGGQLAYWFEESLVAALRESDVLRIGRAELFSTASQRNPFCQEILTRITTGQAWVGLGWRQFMYWFADIEERIAHDAVDVDGLLRGADRAWAQLEDLNIIMEERRNEGQWIRPWLRALREFKQT